MAHTALKMNFRYLLQIDMLFSQAIFPDKFNQASFLFSFF